MDQLICEHLNVLTQLKYFYDGAPSLEIRPFFFFESGGCFSLSPLHHYIRSKTGVTGSSFIAKDSGLICSIERDGI